MSGGTFDYKQYCLSDLSEDMASQFEENKQYMDEETQQIYLKTIKDLEYNAIVVKRLDWLIACDDGQESFHERLADELNEFNSK